MRPRYPCWGALMRGCNLLYHGAGWLVGGLTISKEKFVLDIEILQKFAGLFQPTPFSDKEPGLDEIASVGPGGQFFAAPQTMARCDNAFCTPLVSDWRNRGQWSDDGSKTATERACAILQKTLAEAVADFVARRKAEGGAQPI